MNETIDNAGGATGVPPLQQVLTFTLGAECRALAAVGDRMMMLLDVDRLLATDSAMEYSQVAPQVQWH